MKTVFFHLLLYSIGGTTTVAINCNYEVGVENANNLPNLNAVDWKNRYSVRRGGYPALEMPWASYP